jgi:hypothetical protein
MVAVSLRNEKQDADEEEGTDLRVLIHVNTMDTGRGKYK